MAADYKDVAEFYVVYIREAHAADSNWPMAVPGRTINTPKTYEEREKIAGTCVKDLKIDIPCLIDDMEDTTEAAYRGWPDRMFVVDQKGKIAYRGERGPWGFKPQDARAWLEKRFPEHAAEVKKAREEAAKKATDQP